MNIRLASHLDYHSVVSLMNQLNPDDPTIEESLGRELFTKILGSDGLSIYLAEVEGEIVASCYLNVIPNLTRAGRSYALVENVVTEKKYRRTGIGKSLLMDVIAKAFSLDCYKVMLLTGRESNVHAFYENCGLEKHSKTAFIIRSVAE